MRRLFAPEVVQTSALDCGPAALKSLLEGYRIRVSYGRLREACQTGIDGTSIDSLEAVANQLGLEAEQVTIPADHLILDAARAAPCILVVVLPGGLTHFVVVWRHWGRWWEIMDPAVGRRWISTSELTALAYQHTAAAPAEAWLEFSQSQEFQSALAARLSQLGISNGIAQDLMAAAGDGNDWLQMAAFDASVRLASALVRNGGLRKGEQALALIKRLAERPALIPARYWTAAQCPDSEEVLVRGAVLVRVKGIGEATPLGDLPRELAAAVQEPAVSPGRVLLRFLLQSGRVAVFAMLLAIVFAALGVAFEALLFRGLFDLTGELALRGQRMGAMTALILFSFGVLLLDLPIFALGARLARQLENRLRLAFLTKLPKLSDSYFQSRLLSDMAERSHATHRLRHLPDLLREGWRTVAELGATAAGMIWLEPQAGPYIVAAVLAALVPVFTVQRVLAERDLRVRNLGGGLTRFYLDSMLGLMAIRAHGAERNLKREHEKMLGEWATAAKRLQRAVVSTEAIQLTAMFGLIALLLVGHSPRGGDMGRALLVVYWALNLPVLGQQLGALGRQYPFYRSTALRLMEPLGALEEEHATVSSTAANPLPAGIEFRKVSAAAAGHTILQEVDWHIEPGSHVAVVGCSGAGKSTLAGLLLGHTNLAAGQVLVDGDPVQPLTFRSQIAWVDPAVQLWNRSLYANLSYGSHPPASEVGEAVDAALLRSVLEALPQGLQTPLGEGGGLVSGGEGQRVRFARALLRKDVRLVILDEPFRGLDRDKRRVLLERAREFWRNCTLLCITHDIGETQDFDQVAVMENGRIVESGEPRELRLRDTSRYRELLEAERQTRSEMWSDASWRRVWLEGGTIREDNPAGSPHHRTPYRRGEREKVLS